MNKFLRKAMVLALAGTMTMGMGTTVFAADVTSGFNTLADPIADTKEINFLKDYVNGTSDQADTESPAEDFTFTIENYGLWNVGEDGKGKAKYTKDNMPTFENNTNTFTISADKGAAGTTPSTIAPVKINVPDYDAVGDYWYKVTETDNNVAGVIYGTNDSVTENIANANGGHTGIYYLHVQVTNTSDKKGYIRTVTLHKTAPALTTGGHDTTNTEYESWYADNNGSANQTAKKVDAIQNKYYAGSLKITKKVEGNAGDKNELFKVTVEFKNDTGASMKSDIKISNYYETGTSESVTTDASLGWTDMLTTSNDNVIHSKETFKKDFWIKDGTTVTFSNIPYGVSYTITETQPEDDKYTHKFEYTGNSNDAAETFNGKPTAVDEVFPKDTSTSESSTGSQAQTEWDNVKATGSISDASDTVTLTNTKTSTIDIGVITSNAPYVAVLILAVAALVIYTRRRKDMFEE